jgi:transmembrane sensor
MASHFYDGFLKLLDRYRRGQSTAEENQVMDTWYDALDGSEDEALRNLESKERVWMKIMEDTVPYSDKGEHHKQDLRRILYYAAAALMILIGGITGYLAVSKNPMLAEVAQFTDKGSATHENKTSQPMAVVLPDGSRITLEPESKLSYTDQFNEKTRTVRLEGNAFFVVAENKKVPFIVQTQTIETKVLGTQFFIRKDAVTGKTEVEVVSGKVEVNVTDNKSDAGGKNRHVYLTANLKATFEPQTRELVMGLASAPRLVEQHVVPDTFVFADAPLRDVIARLQKAYGVSIHVANREILNCPITANLFNESLPTQLDIVMTALNADFSIDGRGIYIIGGGCLPAVAK